MTQQASLIYLCSVALVFIIGHHQMFFTTPTNDLQSGFSNDFQQFLDQKYSTFKFERADLRDACYGGADTRPKSKPTKTPVIFIHGNSDIGMGQSGDFTGARALFTYLTQNGYAKSDLYTTTWGNGNPSLASQNVHSKEWVLYIRAFVEAVLEYTKADKVHIVGHSMGVTLARRIVKGGRAKDAKSGTYDIGPALTSRVNHFIGLAGANQGLTACAFAPTVPTCNNVDGFYPGAALVSKSQFLDDLDKDTNKEGSKVITMWSRADELIGAGCIVYGKYTTRIVGQDDEVIYELLTHFGVRDKTSDKIYSFIKGT